MINFRGYYALISGCLGEFSTKMHYHLSYSVNTSIILNFLYLNEQVTWLAFEEDA